MAAITCLIWVVPGADQVANVSLLYLLAVIAVAYRFGGAPAALASVLALLSFGVFLRSLLLSVAFAHRLLRCGDGSKCRTR